VVVYLLSARWRPAGQRGGVPSERGVRRPASAGASPQRLLAGARLLRDGGVARPRGRQRRDRPVCLEVWRTQLDLAWPRWRGVLLRRCERGRQQRLLPDAGFPPPEPPELECSGDECQGDPSGAPADDEPATGGTGAGNPTPTPACDGQQASVDRYDDRIAKLKDKKKRAKRKAKQASGKKAQRKRKRAKRIGKKIRKVRGKKRDAKRDLRACREAQ
jgi:hypothetical protein